MHSLRKGLASLALTAAAMLPWAVHAQELDKLPNYMPVLPAVKARALAVDPSKGFLVKEVKPNVYVVTDGIYQSAFVTTGKGVVLFDAPPSFADKLPAAVAEVTRERPGIAQRDAQERELEGQPEGPHVRQDAERVIVHEGEGLPGADAGQRVGQKGRHRIHADAQHGEEEIEHPEASGPCGAAKAALHQQEDAQDPGGELGQDGEGQERPAQGRTVPLEGQHGEDREHHHGDLEVADLERDQDRQAPEEQGREQERPVRARSVDPAGHHPQSDGQQEPVQPEPQGALRREVPGERGERRHDQQERRRVGVVVEHEGREDALDPGGRRRQPMGAVPPALRVEVGDARSAQLSGVDVGGEAAMRVQERDARERLLLWNRRYTEMLPYLHGKIYPGMSMDELGAIAAAALFPQRTEAERVAWCQARRAKRLGQAEGVRFATMPDGRVIESIDPYGSHLGFGYDAAGRQVTEDDAGDRATFRYDAAGRLVFRDTTWQDTLTYDAAGRLATITSGTTARKSVFNYVADRLVTVVETGEQGRAVTTTTYDYDCAP